MKIKTGDLTGAQLDWAVAICEGLINGDDLDIGFMKEGGYSPSTVWAQGGPIIQSERITLDVIDCGETWIAQDYWKEFPEVEDSTPLIAAMRCYVGSKLGDEIEVPEEIEPARELANKVFGFKGAQA